VSDPQQINIRDFSYELPEDRIAKFPLAERDRSKLLIYKENQISETVFSEIDTIIPEGSLVVFNNTRVIHARLLFQRASGARIEIFCMEPAGQQDHQQSFSSRKEVTWKCMVGNAKRWKDDMLEKQVGEGILLRAKKLGKEDELFLVTFSWEPAELSFAEVLQRAGSLPIPPYLNRDTEQLDEARYQTIYARHDGSVAAPTAGLHFTPAVLDKLAAKHVRKTEVTLHVGAGTFKPVKAEQLGGHEMHAETVTVTREALTELLATMEQNKPVIAVGTTSTRTLESIYWHGLKMLSAPGPSTNINIAQWDPYASYPSQPPANEIIRLLLRHMDAQNVQEIHGVTQIIIVPGYTFRIVDILITNFHQPENTLMLLVAAFAGPEWRNIYDYALAHDFRFLSYGDSSILF
jgi:S-adenosylmethionine:tRNA ribosyltransferase-isomerase